MGYPYTKNVFVICPKMPLFSSVIHSCHINNTHDIDKDVKIEFSLNCERLLEEGVIEL